MGWFWRFEGNNKWYGVPSLDKRGEGNQRFEFKETVLLSNHLITTEF